MSGKIKNKNGVYNKIRFKELNPESYHDDRYPCQMQKTELGYTDCKFLRGYQKGISELDFDRIVSRKRKKI